MSSVLGSLRKAREWAMPTLKQSAFLDKGVLTPEEFVQAGDELVYKCPTWQWEAGDESKRKSYLPDDKQYLITRNVPCPNRVSSMETNCVLERAEGETDDDGEDWWVSNVIRQSELDDDMEDDFDILDSEGEVIETKKPAAVEEETAATAAAADTQEEEEYADMADFEDDNVLQDDAAATVLPSSGNADDNDNVVKVRTYDLSITYDKYYQTPRVWIIGRNQHDQPLTASEMMEDVISDYANKTVTMESHPHVSGPHASIHPCQHGKVMKAIVKNLMKSSELQQQQQQQASADDSEAPPPQGPSVEMYLFIFLKFVSSMIPTINYDFTMDVTADTRKI